MATTSLPSDRFEAYWEWWYPVVFALGSAVVAYFVNLASAEGFRDLLQASVNLSAITVGFLATAKSILFTISQKEIVTALKQAGKWPILIDYIMWAIYSAFVLAIVSGCLLLVKFKKPEPWHVWLFCAWAFAAVLAFATSFRVVRFFARILKMT